ncbi:beta-1,3-galactosyltransferase 1-like [Mercenaria mercenaria]|uniref:beta-1,3-galactosyltransferase 1-like n=1 Tax=Mercenaria mercenaria TaxID=6596 RepID=UPI00234FA60E|nr:beta-1,3-galactosyltransferase 1-like [Mercenaria mercenaria]
MTKIRQLNKCTRLIRDRMFKKVCSGKRLQLFLVTTTFMISTMFFVILSPARNQYDDVLYLTGNLQRKLVVQNGGKNEEIYGAYFQYSGNIPYRSDGFLGKKVLETINAPQSDPVEQNRIESQSEPYSIQYKNDFLKTIDVSEIPLNRSAFGENYTLSETRSDIYDFPFIIDGSDICQNTSHPFLVIMVLSVHTHIDTRSAIRNTWGRAANPGVWPKVGVLKQKVKLVFLFGKAKNELGNNIAREESKMYGDIVQADFVDSYFNLTYKTVMGIRWVAEFCKDAKYVLKADEDVFVHVHNLITFLSKREKKNHGVIFGHALIKSDVFREGRWAVSKHAFPLSVYPTYTCGNTYVIPGKMAAHIYYTAGLLPYLNIEDVFVTGIVRMFLNAELVDVMGFTHWFEKKPRPCEFKNQIRISATKVTDNMQNGIWEGLKTKEADCYKVIRVKHVNQNRPDSFARSKLIRDEHIFMNKTNGKFFVL